MMKDDTGCPTKNEIKSSAKEMFTICRDWKTTELEEKKENSSKLVAIYKVLTESIHSLIESNPSDAGAREATVAIQELGALLMAHMDVVMDKDPKNADLTIAELSKKCFQVISLINNESSREEAMEGVQRELEGVAADLETHIMFISIGVSVSEVEPGPFSGETSARTNTGAEYRERLLAKATTMVEDTKAVLSQLSSEEGLPVAAATLVAGVRQLVEEVKLGAASLGDQCQEEQVGSNSYL